MAQGNKTGGKQKTNCDFYMLGVIHRDREGPKPFSEWLERISPDVITLELSRYGLGFRQERGGLYRKQIADALTDASADRPGRTEDLAALYSYLEIPYEYEVSYGYAKEHNKKLYLIDMDLFSYLWLRQAGTLFTPDNIRRLFEGNGGADNGGNGRNSERVHAELFFKKGIRTVPYSYEMYVRDRYMADRIALLIKYHRDRRILHVCGWRHLWDPHNIYSVFMPTKVFIHDTALRV